MTIRHMTESDAITAAERREQLADRGIDWRDDPDYVEPRETDGEEEGDDD